ncbi:exopolyphosphatase [Alicyclobacillus ferrooxydans]|uniref:Exopolyphosphatase n=1 Tax=Alicyclobacillus ferrooxydans TaxID=471514 RepID=A0A0N8PPK1_9BACL|nr:exopolyphosphatase [Alicyclobacillus ferrooxydans]KPV44549.1 hypothetical protein AN477_05965 [Alicyclobacillus ferrooxydans]
MPDELKAVIDLGSNSVRLVIYQQGPHGTGQEVDNLKQTVRLSNHLDENNNISDKGISVTLAVLRQFQQLCQAYQVTEVIGVATQAMRIAANRDAFLEQIFDATGIRFQVLPGTEEARYGYLAVVNSLAIPEGVTVDIGGGSTEIAYFRDRKLVHHVSIPYGAVSLTREYVRSNPLPAKELKALENVISERLSQHPWLEGLRCPVIGLGGTARSVARIHQRQHHYPLQLLHGYEMWPLEVTTILDMVRSLPLDKRSDIAGLSQDRSDIIVAGSAILDQVLKRVEATQFVISNKGLRDGILVEKVLQTLKLDILPDILMYSIENIQDHFRLNRKHAFHVWNLSSQMLNAIMKLGWLPENRDLNRWLQVAALLHDLGRTVSIYNVRSHTFYLLLQVPLLGVSHRDRVIAAAIASYKTTKQTTVALAEYQELLGDDDISLVAQLGTLLGLARALDRTETSAVESVDLVSVKGNQVLRLRSRQTLDLEFNLAAEWLKKWKKVFQREVRLEVEQVAHSENV